MEWLSIAPALVVALLIVVLPGVVLAFAFGLRGFAIPALAPALSLSVIACASTVSPLVHLRWSVWPVLGTTAVGAAVLAGLRLKLRRFDRPREFEAQASTTGVKLANSLTFVIALAIPAVILAKSLTFAFDGPHGFSQTFDNVFHLNALEYIREAGSASSFDIGRIAGSSYYPAGWHALVSLVGTLSSSGIPESVNATNLVIGAIVWPLSMLYLLSQIFGSRPVAMISGGVMCACFAAYPLVMVDYGVLYPVYLSLALLPACVGQIFFALGLGARRPENSWVAWFTLGGIAVGMTVSHPSALMALIVVGIPPVIGLYIKKIGPRLTHGGWRDPAFVLPSLALLAGLVAAAGLWRYVRPDPAAAFWPPTQTIAQAVGEALTVSPHHIEPSWLVGGLVLLGLYRGVRFPQRWATLGLFLMLAALYVVVSGFDPGRVRSLITGIWYNDSYRLAAMLPLAAIPVAVEGLLQVEGWVRRMWDRARERISKVRAGAGRGWAQAQTLAGTAGLVVVVLGLIGVSQTGQVPAEELAAKSLYQVRPDSPLVSSDEMVLLKRLDSHVPADAVIAGSPWTGTSLAYALADRKTLQLHILSATSPAIDAVDTGLKDALTNPAACNAIKELHVQYVLDFGTQEVHREHHAYQGVEDLQGSSAVTLVDQQGAARLYKVTACQS